MINDENLNLTIYHFVPGEGMVLKHICGDPQAAPGERALQFDYTACINFSDKLEFSFLLFGVVKPELWMQWTGDLAESWFKHLAAYISSKVNTPTFKAQRVRFRVAHDDIPVEDRTDGWIYDSDDYI